MRSLTDLILIIPSQEENIFLIQLGKYKQLPEELFADIGFQAFIKATVAVFVAYVGLSAAQFSTNWLSEQVPNRFRLQVKKFLPFFKGIILVSAVYYISNLFLNLSPNNLLTVTGTVAVALGFAFKDYVSSIIAGLVALYEVPYQVGDRVQIGQYYGEVVRYNLRSIKIRTANDEIVTIPHSTIWTDPISSANRGELEAQTVTDCYFTHDVDVHLVTQILYQAAYTSKYTQLQRPITVAVEEKPWGTQFKLKCYPMDARDEFTYQTDLLKRAKQVFAQHNLSHPALADV